MYRCPENSEHKQFTTGYVSTGYGDCSVDEDGNVIWYEDKDGTFEFDDEDGVTCAECGTEAVITIPELVHSPLKTQATVLVKETVHLTKEVVLEASEHTDIPSAAVYLAMKDLPDYNVCGWELVGSEGCDTEILSIEKIK